MLGLRPNSRENEVRCPFCHSAVLESDRLWVCPGCGTAHHQDCARENERCTLLGCGRPVSVARAEGEAALPRVERSARANLRRNQDFMVLGVSVGSVALLALAQFSGLEGGIPTAVLALLAIGLVGGVARWIRRRNRIGG